MAWSIANAVGSCISNLPFTYESEPEVMPPARKSSRTLPVTFSVTSLLERRSVVKRGADGVSHQIPVAERDLRIEAAR